jgi:hypothetical protein
VFSAPAHWSSVVTSKFTNFLRSPLGKIPTCFGYSSTNLVRTHLPKPSVRSHVYFSRRCLNYHATSYLSKFYPSLVNSALSFSFKEVSDKTMFEKIKKLNRVDPGLDYFGLTSCEEVVSYLVNEFKGYSGFPRLVTAFSKIEENPWDFSNVDYEPTAHPGYPYCNTFQRRSQARPKVLRDLELSAPFFFDVEHHLHIV